MLKSLKIKNFRCFEEFALPQLGRVNLLVGKNNSGKTSILEAVHLLSSPTSIRPLLDIMDYRGEYSLNVKDINNDSFEVSHLFCGHQMNDESHFAISAIQEENKEIEFEFRLVRIKSLKLEPREDETESDEYIQHFSSLIRQGLIAIELSWKDNNKFVRRISIPLNNVSTNEMIKQLQLSAHVLSDSGKRRSQFVCLNSSDMNTVISDFNAIVLTPQEEILYESLRIIEPGIERIAAITAQGSRKYGSEFIISINKQRVPIGVMGYGIWRMLEITLAMVNIPGGTLLIDEIDTGLHFSVMIDLWKLICKTAEKLDIQVFATTHNSDCWKSLAEVANSDDIASDDITIHRIERGKKASVVFNEEEMAIAAERDIEVR
jgi:AAA15 family ATPase/GTPase